MFLEDNGYDHAMEAVDDVRLAHMIQNMRDADVTEADLAHRLAVEVGHEEHKPDFRFVFYKGVLDIRDYDHNLGYPDMLKDILSNHGKDVNDDNVQDDEMASGDVTRRNGELDIELKNLADESVQQQALAAIHTWAEGMNLIGDIHHIGAKTMDIRPATGRDMISLPEEKILRIDNPLSDLHGTAWVVDEGEIPEVDSEHHTSTDKPKMVVIGNEQYPAYATPADDGLYYMYFKMGGKDVWTLAYADGRKVGDYPIQGA
jgi:hypothetical protein